MESFTVNLVDPFGDFDVHFCYITRESKRMVADKLLEGIANVRDTFSTLGTCSRDVFYKAWLTVFHGDLKNRGNRDFAFLDTPQIRQVYDYITLVLEIPLPPFQPDARHQNEHLFAFFSAVHSVVYREIIFGAPDMDLVATRTKYEAVRAELETKMLESYEVRVEDMFFERGLWIAENELETVKRALTAPDKFYNADRAEDRFRKLWKYHGARPQLVATYFEWYDVVTTQYLDPWLDDCTRKATSPSVPPNVAQRTRAILAKKDDLLHMFHPETVRIHKAAAKVYEITQGAPANVAGAPREFELINVRDASSCVHAVFEGSMSGYQCHLWRRTEPDNVITVAL